MADYGIRTSVPNNSVFGASGTKLNFDTSLPFIKLDTQKKGCFKTTTLLITNDPPEPSGGAFFAYTELFKFEHGYTYKPSLETLFYVTNPPVVTNFYQKYFQDCGIIGSRTSGSDVAFIWAVADERYVRIICGKYLDSGFFGQPNLLTGVNIDITFHIFVEDIEMS